MNTTRDIDYEFNNIGFDEQYPDGGIKCKNYINCREILPTWWFDYKETYLCTICNKNKNYKKEKILK